MFEVMPESGGRVLAVRLLQAYSKKDVLAFEKLLEEWIDRVGGQLDMLVKLDGLNLRRVPVENYIEDCRRTLAHRESLRRIAVVGDSDFARSLVSLDNLIMANAAHGITERYFDVAQLEEAWSFLRA
ncbi:STAS/SEC14 domain-containing protein [Desulfoferula mesophila]|uniref:STAS/SEC14 domain-containing protein n=1 Tax=Desulfoferula mesophila TaxID=3058419 RepID=A0AAU9ETM3_9BACT|nr:hypothetical protein FAK_41920 [Desulfoferula mesophilus]